jgi:putative transposase
VYPSPGVRILRGTFIPIHTPNRNKCTPQDHFQKQIRYWGITPSFAFVAEPQTNGVAERFIRPMKEEAVYGRVFKNVEEVRAAVAAFVLTYNTEGRLEKLGFMTPREARETYDRALAA